jgi:hydrogenase-1 operon protein HyaE
MMMLRPLERLAREATPVSLEDAAGFLAQLGWSLVLLSGDASQRAEAQDLAVVVHELLDRAPKGTRVGLVTDVDEAKVRGAFHVPALPALLWVRDGQVLSTIAKIQDWAVYARAADVFWGTARPAPEVTP